MAKSSHSKLKVELDDLVRRIALARALLLQVKGDTVVARRLLSAVDDTDLLEANERLVVAAVEHQIAIESAMQALHELTLSAQLDPLTKLPNRAMMHDRISQAISSAKRSDQGFALLFIDVNGFKQINDTMGHAAGDQVLRKIAKRFVASVRDVDTVSRHGGDEFLVLLPEVARSVDAALVANKVARATAAAMTIGSKKLNLEISIGISLHPSDGQETDALIESADVAMYKMKHGPSSSRRV